MNLFPINIYRTAAVYLVLLISLCFLSFQENKIPQQNAEEKPTARYLVKKLITATDDLKTLTFDLRLKERKEGTLTSSSSSIKIQRSPRKVYMKLKGPELLFVNGWNDNKVLVNPGGFPYMNLNLDPNSNTLHKNQHHTINEVGLDYTMDIIKDAVKRSGDQFDSYFTYDGESNIDNKSYYKLTITDRGYKFKSYVPVEGETLISVARKLKISEYKILELNKLSDFGLLKASKSLVIPTSYARITEIFMDKKTFLPYSMKIYDNDGLFESYDYLNMKINPVFAPDEFSKNFKGYGF